MLCLEFLLGVYSLIQTCTGLNPMMEIALPTTFQSSTNCFVKPGLTTAFVPSQGAASADLNQYL